MTLFELAVIVILVSLIYKISFFITKRMSLVFKIMRLKKEKTAEILDFNLAAFFSHRPSKKAAIRLSVNSKIYAVRLFDGKNYRHSAHIANETYATVFLKTGGATKARRFVVGVKTVTESARVYFPKTVFLPDLSEDNADAEILIFSPAPRDLTFVSAERTSIKAAFTGDVVYGMKIFTASTFENFIDRDSRGFFDD